MSQPTSSDPVISDPGGLALKEDVLPLYQERVSVTRRRVPTQVVRATRTTHSYEHRIEEMLRHERVVVERVPIGQIVPTMPLARQEGDVMILPVVEEQLVMRKQFFLKEEVRVRRVVVSEQHVETVSLREQDVAVRRSKINNDAAIPSAAHSPTTQDEEFS